ncbi:hypothetical protein PG994_001379 [Apiospora phragmitis]|uniref:Uncharacterized protein n=1 Tax=Apiospora phragmitis TaxID=2905665 RepID=A0ABR1WTD5_9PEZI
MREEKGLRFEVLASLLHSATELGDLSLCPDFFERLEESSNSFQIRDTRFRAIFKLLDARPDDTHVTIAVATSWKLTPEQKMVMVLKTADAVDNDDIIERLRFKFLTCDPPLQETETVAQPDVAESQAAMSS